MGDPIANYEAVKQMRAICLCNTRGGADVVKKVKMSNILNKLK